MEKRFLQEVVDSKIGLCLSLAPNEHVQANSSLATLHVERTIDISGKTHLFPCVNYSSPPRSRVEFSVTETSLSNMTCLGLASFSSHIQALGHNRTRASDILYVSISQNTTFVNVIESDAVHLKVPLIKSSNSSQVLEV